MSIDLFRKIRHILGFTQQEYAEFLGISQAYVGMIETGRRIPSDRVIGKLRQEVDADLIEKIDELINLKVTLEN